MDYRAQILKLCDDSVEFFDKQFDESESVVLKHEANGAMAAIRALKREIEKVTYVAKKGSE